ncbi:glycosyltransferase family A protein [soil metagenome]
MDSPIQPLVSVILPVYNGAKFLPEAIASVFAQNHGAIQLIVVDDGSTDGSAAIAKDLAPDAEIIRQANAGPAAARNAGLAVARGEVIAFLDADDVWPGDKLARQLPEVTGENAADMVVGQMRKFRMGENSSKYEYSESYFMFVLGCALIRRKLFDAVGDFDTTMSHGFSDDTDWFFRAWEKTDSVVRFQYFPTIFYRRHRDNITGGMDCVSNGFLLAIKKSLDRRRAAQKGGASPALPIREVPSLK